MDGVMQSVEFVDEHDEQGREPGTYITIRLNENLPIGAGRVRVEYVTPDAHVAECTVQAPANFQFR
jgi:hypothetical protein